MTKTEALAGIFPNATITLNGNRMIVLYQYRKGSMSDLEIENSLEFAILLRKAIGFSISCFLENDIKQIKMVFDFEEEIGLPGILQIITHGTVENKVFNPTLSPEVREFQQRMESDIAQKKLKEFQRNPPDAEELAGFLQRALHGNDHLYKDHSITTMDKLSRWKKLCGIATSGVLPFDSGFTEPSPRTSDTAGVAEIFIENDESSIAWVFTPTEIEAFADCVECADPGPIFSPGIDDTGSELEIFFVVEVYGEK